MELGFDLQQNLHAGMQLLPRGALEVGTDDHPFRGPAPGRGLGDGCGTSLVFLDQFEETVTVALAALRQLCLYPILIRHLALNHLAHQ